MSLPAAHGQDLPTPLPGGPQPRGGDVAHALRLLRLLITAVDHADGGVLTLSRESALVGVIRRLMAPSEADLHTTRTAVMALRDLVQRMDLARHLLEAPEGAVERRALAALLDTTDIHAFLKQEP